MIKIIFAFITAVQIGPRKHAYLAVYDMEDPSPCVCDESSWRLVLVPSQIIIMHQWSSAPCVVASCFRGRESCGTPFITQKSIAPFIKKARGYSNAHASAKQTQLFFVIHFFLFLKICRLKHLCGTWKVYSRVLKSHTAFRQGGNVLMSSGKNHIVAWVTLPSGRVHVWHTRSVYQSEFCTFRARQ